MKTLYAKALFKVASYRVETHLEQIAFWREDSKDVSYDTETRFLVLKEGEYNDLKSSGWAAPPSLYFKSPQKSCFSHF